MALGMQRLILNQNRKFRFAWKRLFSRFKVSLIFEKNKAAPVIGGGGLVDTNGEVSTLFTALLVYLTVDFHP